MGRPAKFTVRRREQILELLRAGASRRMAATASGIDHSTLTKWIRRGEQARHSESQYRRFRDAVLEAEAHPGFIERHQSGSDQDGGSQVITLKIDE
jgi:transposase